jgi:hypothetical protein
MINTVKQAIYTAAALVLLIMQEIDFKYHTSRTVKYWQIFFTTNKPLASEGYRIAFKMLFKREA